MGGVSDEILLARAYLSRVAEPANIPLWDLVRQRGPVEAVAMIRGGTTDPDVTRAVAARADHVDAEADLCSAERHGIRLLVPESDEWPHFALSALERTGVDRLGRWVDGDRRHSDAGEEIPPLALWAKGPLDVSVLGVRSVGLVGARSATEYGTGVARAFARTLSESGFVVVSGGAFGIDAAAHRGALEAGGHTVAVSAGGVDRAYPASHGPLFDRIGATGVILSESPPGSTPQRHRFLTRNRLIAALSTGTIIVEAAIRSGALNTASHCTKQGRPLMAVPGPVTSIMSGGCHQILAREEGRANLVATVQDVVDLIGNSSDVPASNRRPDVTVERDPFRRRLDSVDVDSRRVFDGFPIGRPVATDDLVALTGMPLGAVLGALPLLELAGLVEPAGTGFRAVMGLQNDDPGLPGDRRGRR